MLPSSGEQNGHGPTLPGMALMLDINIALPSASGQFWNHSIPFADRLVWGLWHVWKNLSKGNSGFLGPLLDSVCNLPFSFLPSPVDPGIVEGNAWNSMTASHGGPTHSYHSQGRASLKSRSAWPAGKDVWKQNSIPGCLSSFAASEKQSQSWEVGLLDSRKWIASPNQEQILLKYRKHIQEPIPIKLRITAYSACFLVRSFNCDPSTGNLQVVARTDRWEENQTVFNNYVLSHTHTFSASFHYLSVAVGMRRPLPHPSLPQTKDHVYSQADLRENRHPGLASEISYYV